MRCRVGERRARRKVKSSSAGLPLAAIAAKGNTKNQSAKKSKTRRSIRSIVERVVEHVEEVSGKSHVHALFNLEVLEQGEIRVPSSRPLVKPPGVRVDDISH